MVLSEVQQLFPVVWLKSPPLAVLLEEEEVTKYRENLYVFNGLM